MTPSGVARDSEWAKIIEESPAATRKSVLLVVLPQPVQQVGPDSLGPRAARKLAFEDPATRAPLFLAARLVVFEWLFQFQFYVSSDTGLFRKLARDRPAGR
jgi:hypothetical protein